MSSISLSFYFPDFPFIFLSFPLLIFVPYRSSSIPSFCPSPSIYFPHLLFDFLLPLTPFASVFFPLIVCPPPTVPLLSALLLSFPLKSKAWTSWRKSHLSIWRCGGVRFRVCHFGVKLLCSTESVDKKIRGLCSDSIYLEPLCQHIIRSLHTMNRVE